MLDILLLGFFPALVVYAAVSDMLTMTIPNRVSLLLVAGFFLVAALGGLAWSAVGAHLLAGAAFLAFTFGLFAAGLIGGGDAKLGAAIALWFGFGGLLDYLLITTLAGGVLSLVLMGLRRWPLPAFASGWSWSRRLHDATSGIPYGIALAFGGLAVYPHTDLWRLAFTG